MHCSALLATALAVGTLAMPYNGNLEARKVFTVVETAMETVTVRPTVTEQPPATTSSVSAPDFSPPTEADIGGSEETGSQRSKGFPISDPLAWFNQWFQPSQPRPQPQPQPPAVQAFAASSSVRKTSSSTRRQSSSTRKTPSSAIKTSSSRRSSSLTTRQTSSRSSSRPAPFPPSSTRTSTTKVSSTLIASVAATPQPASGHTSGPSQALLSSGSEYQAAVLYHHNAARANHDAAPLVWDSSAEKNARIAAERCVFEHYIPSGVKNGQNLFTTSGKYFNVTAGITESWYKSEFPPMAPYYGQANIPSDVFHKVGHLTQLLWKGTTGVGCVSIDCGTKMIVNGASSTLNKYTVCNYSPPGNYANRYAENVGRPKSNTKLGSWSD